MRGIRLAGVLLALLSFQFTARAQLVVGPGGEPPSVFEYHEGTYTLANGTTQSATLKLAMLTEQIGGRKSKPFAKLVVRAANGGLVPIDSATEFAYDNRRFVRVGRLTPDVTLRFRINSDFVEPIVDTGRIELYSYYPRRGNRYVVSSATPGVIHEGDLKRAFIWRRRGAKQLDVMVSVPPSGFNPEFENQLQALFFDRPDILAFIEKHQIRAEDLPAVVRAYNADLKLRFQ